MIRDYQDTDKEQLRQLVIESNMYQKGRLEKEALDIEKVRAKSAEIFESVLEEKEQHYIVATDGERLVGFILVEVSSMYVGRGSVDDLFVQEGYRSQGRGKELLDAGLKWMKERGVQKAGIGVHRSNEVAIKLYINAGFEEVPETYISLEKELR